VTLFDPAIGGRLALALLNAIVATIITARGIRALGWSGMLIAPVLWLGAPPFLLRAVRLRPEWLALIVILLAITVVVRRRPLLLGVLAFVFTLAYTAFHVFLGLCFFWAIYDWVITRERRYDRVTWPIVGAILGLALHPHPLQYLKIWYVQNVLFFLHKQELNVGVEILPPQLVAVAIACVGWLIAMAVISLLQRRAAAAGPPAPANFGVAPAPRGDATTAYAAIAAAVFTILFLFMTRMATYAFPLLTLVAVEWARGHAYVRRHDLARAGIFAVCCLLGLPGAGQLRPVQLLLDAGSIAPERAWESFGRSIPPDAKVATDWVSGEHYAFWAPQGRYLNVLDPIFMALPYPIQYRALRGIYSGDEPDVPGQVATILDSHYLALDTTAVPPLLLARLEHDPRVTLVRAGSSSLYRMWNSNSAFVTTWDGMQVKTAFIPIGARCATRTHLEPSHAEPQSYELAPYGPTALLVDGTQLTNTTADPLAILGRGFRFTLPPSLAPQTIEVRTCPARNGMGGFYLRNVPRATAVVHVPAVK